MRPILTRSHAYIDRIGIFLSAACMLHCALVPVILAFGLAHNLGVGVSDAVVHLVMGLVVLPVSALAFWGGWTRHGRDEVLITGIAGMLILLAGATVVHDQLGFVGDAIVTSVGSALLIYAHWQNQACGCTSRTSG